MSYNYKAIDNISGILCRAAQHVLKVSTHKNVAYSTTIQSIPKIAMKPEIGCFVQLSGDYNGLFVANFSGDAALNIYKSYMTSMGIPEDELTNDFHSNEVLDSIGELVNQIMGKFMKNVGETYELSANCGQPKVIALNSAITLKIDADYSENRRLSFNIENHHFIFEVSMEKTEFITLPEGDLTNPE